MAVIQEGFLGLLLKREQLQIIMDLVLLTMQSFTDEHSIFVRNCVKSCHQIFLASTPKYAMKSFLTPKPIVSDFVFIFMKNSRLHFMKSYPVLKFQKLKKEEFCNIFSI